MEKKVNKSKKCDCVNKPICDEELNKIAGGRKRISEPCYILGVCERMKKLHKAVGIPEKLYCDVKKNCDKQRLLLHCDDWGHQCEAYKFLHQEFKKNEQGRIIFIN